MTIALGASHTDKITAPTMSNANPVNRALLATKLDLNLPFLTPECHNVLSQAGNISVKETFHSDNYNLSLNIK